MRKFGYIDEDAGYRTTFYQTFVDDDCEVILYEIDEQTTLLSLIEQISEHQLDMLIIDYNLVETGVVTFNGDIIVNEIRKKFHKLPLMVLTSDEGDALNHVMDGLIVYSKEDHAEKPSIFKHKIFNTIDNYKKSITEKKDTIKALTDKRNSTELTNDEEELLFKAYLYLNEVYPDDQDIADYLTQPSRLESLVTILQESNKLVNELKSLS